MFAGTSSESNETFATPDLGAGDATNPPLLADTRDGDGVDMPWPGWTVIGDHAFRRVTPAEREAEVKAFVLSLVERGFAPVIKRAVARGDVRGVDILVSYNKSIVYDSDRADLIAIYRDAEAWLAVVKEA